MDRDFVATIDHPEPPGGEAGQLAAQLRAVRTHLRFWPQHGWGIFAALAFWGVIGGAGVTVSLPLVSYMTAPDREAAVQEAAPQPGDEREAPGFPTLAPTPPVHALDLGGRPGETPLQTDARLVDGSGRDAGEPLESPLSGMTDPGLAGEANLDAPTATMEPGHLGLAQPSGPEPFAAQTASPAPERMAALDQPSAPQASAPEMQEALDQFPTPGSGRHFVLAGSFTEEDQAAAASTRLETLGLEPQTHRSEILGRVFSHVMIGPFPTGEAAQTAARLIDEAGLDAYMFFTSRNYHLGESVDPVDAVFPPEEMPAFSSGHFMVLAGSFTEGINQRLARGLLFGHGIFNSSQEVTVRRRLFHRILVGPFATRLLAEKAVEVIRARTELAATVMALESPRRAARLWRPLRQRSTVLAQGAPPRATTTESSVTALPVSTRRLPAGAISRPTPVTTPAPGAPQALPGRRTPGQPAAPPPGHQVRRPDTVPITITETTPPRGPLHAISSRLAARDPAASSSNPDAFAARPAVLRGSLAQTAPAPLAAEPLAGSLDSEAAGLVPSEDAGRFALLVGVFDLPEDARSTIQRLEQYGISYYMKEAEMGGRRFTQILVGPFEDKRGAREAANRIQTGAGLPTFFIAI